VPGAVFGALAIAAYDRFLVEGITNGLHGLGTAFNIPALLSLDLRQHNFAVFGIALYLATLYRARGGESTIRSPDTPSAPSRFAVAPEPHLQERSAPSPTRSRGAPRSGP
jgi:hypothetical protein